MLISITQGSVGLSPLSWVVDSVPDIVIGAVDDPDQGLFRIEGVRTLSTGQVVALDGGNKELRFFDASGRLLSRVGRQGEGPGEFLEPVLIPTPLSDSLFVWDRGLIRFQVFSETGQNPRTISLRGRWPAGGLPPVGGVGASMLVRDPQTWDSPNRQYGPRETEVDFLWFDLETDRATPITSSEVTPVYAKRLSGLAAPGIQPIPFAADPSGIVSSAGALISNGYSYEIREYDFDGRVSRIFRVEAQRRPVTGALIEELIHREVERHPRARSFLEEVYAEMPIPDSLPVFERLVLDSEGWVWAELFTPDPSQETEWVVFDEEGRARGTVNTPSGLDVYEVGGGYILGVWVDELGVEFVKKHRLQRESSARSQF